MCSVDGQRDGTDAASCLGRVGAAHAVLEKLDPEAAAYRAGVELIFGARARIGSLLRRIPY